ncbi:VanZ family protein [Virgibacillus proomii]|jgi:glycopeptide antibiotics resistance protein|nr:VanZ family protein [Virgibacillus proomii]
MKKLGYIFLFSLSLEVCQYIFGLGATDITDIVTNGTGGFFRGLLFTLF